MDIRDRDGLKSSAAASLAQATYDPKRLALIHTGAVLCLSLVLTVLDFILNGIIEDTGGLSGMGTRSVLSTAQAMLRIGNLFFVPFWEIGMVAAAISLARQQHTTPGILLSGFRRFGPVLRLFLLQALVYLFLGFLSMQISSGIFILSPFSTSMAEAIEPLLTQWDGQAPVLNEEILQAMLPHLLPLYGIFGVVFCAFAIPVSYRFRMAQYVILDEPKTGALKAMGMSHGMMRYNRFSLFKLDLSFWWFYALELLSGVLCYGDVILSSLGVSLPMNKDAAFFLFLGLYCLCQLALAWWAVSRVQTTYAMAYHCLGQESEDPERPTTRNFPWDFLPH